MSGNKYLLDTNFILGILKSNSLVLAALSSRRLLAGECSYSAITRMELLGFHGIVWVKFVGTHAQYDQINVETVNEY